MSLLQDALDEIEAEAEKKSSVAIANADKILDLECLVKTLRDHGAKFVWPCLTVHSHYADIKNPDAITGRIITRTCEEYELVLEALHEAEMIFTTEIGTRIDGRESIIHRVVGMDSYIECLDTDGGTMARQKQAA